MGLGVAGDGGGAARPTYLWMNCGQIFRVLDIWTSRACLLLLGNIPRIPAALPVVAQGRTNVRWARALGLTLDGKAQDHDAMRMCSWDLKLVLLRTRKPFIAGAAHGVIRNEA